MKSLSYMPTHRISFLVDCANTCDRFPNYCKDCLKNRLLAARVPFREFEIHLERDEEHFLEGARDIVFRKYHDVLNIKTVMVLDKTGLCIYNHPVTGARMDGNLVAGFIQANLAFSQAGVADQINHESQKKEEIPQELSFVSLEEKVQPLQFGKPKETAPIENGMQKIYQLDYQNFVLLVQEGAKVRTVLILEDSPSFQMRSLLAEFTKLFEKIYREALDKFNGEISIFSDARLIVEKVFETDLLFPYSIRLISPTEEESLDSLEKITYKFGYEQSQKKGFFFITSILESLKESLQKPSKDILLAIYDLVKKGYFIPQDIKDAAQYLEEMKEASTKSQEARASLSSFNTSEINEAEIKDLKSQIEFISEKEAKSRIKKYINIADDRIELGIYEDAMRQYELAKVVATEMGMLKELTTVTNKMQDLIDLVNKLEYENAMSLAVAAEKNKEYLKAIQHYNTCKKILMDRFNYDESDKRIQQLNKRINNMQSKVR